MKAVNRPGSLYFSMIAVCRSHSDRSNFRSSMTGGTLPDERAVTTS